MNVWFERLYSAHNNVEEYTVYWLTVLLPRAQTCLLSVDRGNSSAASSTLTSHRYICQVCTLIQGRGRAAIFNQFTDDTLLAAIFCILLTDANPIKAL